MRVRVFTAVVAAGATCAVLVAARPTAAPVAPSTGVTLKTIGPLAFGPGHILFAADTDAAAIVALDLGAGKSAPGAKPTADFDQQLAALLGTTPSAVAITDMAVQPGTRHAYFSVMRGTGADAKPALVRLDGAGALTLVALDKVPYTTAALPNAPAAAPTERRNPRPLSVTDMVFHDGRLLVAGLSNEEFSSKLRAVKYPFESVDAGTSVEIYHGNHGALETRSPVYTLTPYAIGGTPHLLAGYLCTPLVKFPASVVTAGGKVRGTTIAELGNRNRPIDMFVYSKDGKDYLLMSNTSRGVMKIPADTFGAAAPITERVEAEKAGVPYETVTSLTGVEQMDLFDKTHALVLARAGADAPRTLTLVPLP